MPPNYASSTYTIFLDMSSSSYLAYLLLCDGAVTTHVLITLILHTLI